MRWSALSLLLATSLHAQETSPMPAKGTFEVKLAPMEAYDHSTGSPLGRMSIDKVYHGDLEGTGKGEMLTGMTAVKESAGYVAVERVEGALRGKRGSFLLLHRGVMTRGTPDLSVTIIPDSGTGALAGIAGTLHIIIESGKHSYSLDYTLP